jgi:hypothetical protein
MNRIPHFSLRRLVQSMTLALLAFWALPVKAQTVLWTDNNFTVSNSETMYVVGCCAYDGSYPYAMHVNTFTSTPLLWGVATDETYVYYSDETNGYIGRAALNGDGGVDNWKNVGGHPAGLCFYGGYVYWADSSTHYIGRIKLSDGTFDATFFATGGNPYGVKVNASNIFWVSGGNVGTATFDGTNIGTHYANWAVSALGTPFLIDLALDNTYVYFADQHSNKIQRAPLSAAGGATATIDSWLADLSSFNAISSIAISSSSMYVATYGGMAKFSIGAPGTVSAFSPKVAGYMGGITLTTSATVTEVTLTSFTATPTATQVKVAWQTGSEVDTAGFNVWRSASATGAYTKVNGAILPAQGSGVSGASYAWTDTNVSVGQTWYYKLEDIDTHGVSTLHGPVSATVGATSPILSFQATPADIFLGGGSLLNWTVTGSPALSLVGLGPVSASSLWVTPQASTSYTLMDGLGNQTLTTVNVKPFGLLDMPGLSKAWGSVKGEANYNPSYDLNGDGKVDDADVALLFKGL